MLNTIAYGGCPSASAIDGTSGATCILQWQLVRMQTAMVASTACPWLTDLRPASTYSSQGMDEEYRHCHW
ncbi:hypothetical protein KPH14_006811 [Odynerus spinipes]|uniref:Uncharacterized protein n=1 Tax=Odynerus spinipes TaxID=1348599 RepID=A0AAD9VRP8_9HYME|nr:hypothetical protein KPH14_006811 [Odynerus spinipes]